MLRPATHIDVDSLPEYPLDGTERLDSHWWMPWNRQRWLTSDMRLRGSPECRAHYLDLIWMSFDHQPIGTLPPDTVLLSKMLFLSEDHFRGLCAMTFGPLHRWEPCQWRGNVRLMHPVVLEVITENIARKEDNRAQTEAANRSARLRRLRERLAAFDVGLAKNDSAVRWIDRWFEDQNVRRRDDRQMRAALSAWMEHVHAATGGRR